MTLNDLNERFAIISVSNRVVVMQIDPDNGGSIRELWDFAEFKKLLIKHRIKKKTSKGDVIVQLADEWLKNKHGKQYRRLVYAMPGSVEQFDPKDYNGWRGFTCEPKPGDWSQNREHVLKVICNGNQAHFAWLLNWCAALVQRPGQHAWSSIVLRGGQGIGKGHFVDKMLGKMFYMQQYLHMIGANQLTAEFNEHLSGKALVFADEATWGGDPRHAAKLKGLVTEDNVPIHRKFLKMVEEPSALHIVIASNGDWPIPAEWDDRRFFVLDVNESRKQDEAYFAPLVGELENSGRAAMLHDLLAHEVDWAALRHPPDTDAKRDLKSKSISADERWLINWLMDDDGYWKPRQARSVVYGNYCESLKGTAARILSVDGLGRFFKTIFKRAKSTGKWPRGGKVTTNDVSPFGKPIKRRVNAWEFPAIAEFRRIANIALGTDTEWPTDDDIDRPPLFEGGREDGQ